MFEFGMEGRSGRAKVVVERVQHFLLCFDGFHSSGRSCQSTTLVLPEGDVLGTTCGVGGGVFEEASLSLSPSVTFAKSRGLTWQLSTLNNHHSLFTCTLGKLLR